MRNTLKATTLESKFPLLSVENDVIVSKDADVTVAFRVELPELYTVTSTEYEAIHSAWVKAMKVLPDYSIVHKQDIFIRENYKPDTDREDISFLSRSFERHFNERPFLNHTCYLFLTKTTKERSRTQSNFNSLCRGFIVPKEIKDREAVAKFIEAVGQFASIMNESGFVKLHRLTTDEIVGTVGQAGIVEKYFSLSQTDTTTLKDISLGADEMKIGDNILCLHTLSDVEDLPGNVMTDIRYEKLSTDRSDCRLSFASPVGLLLLCNHILNQYVFIDDSAANLQKFEKMAKNMHSLSRYSRSNQINKEWIDEYLNEAHSFGLTSVRCHCNVMAWSDDREELKRIKNEVGSQLALMECKPRHNTVDTPTLFWAGIPGNAADFPAEESFYTFIEQAVCFFAEETNYKNSPSPFGIKMVDRLTGKPLHVDISDLPMKKGITTNRNKFVLGPSGSGKSFFMNHMVRQYYEQGTHVVLVDTGNSYQGLCEMINKKTKGEDGIYFTYTEENPISFNPFYTDDLIFDVEKKDSIKTLLLTLWKSEDDKITKTESGELGSAVTAYIDRIKADRTIIPNFNTFYEFMRDVYRTELEERDIKVSREDFNLDNFLTTLRQYYRGGRFDFLLNSDKNIDLLNKRFIVFEIDAIKENKELFPVVTIIIMEAFINKMRRLKGIRKQIIVEEAWKALSSPSMSEYLKYLYKTVRKYFGEAIVVTQEVDDIISSPVVKEAIINNSDCKILLDQRKYMNKFDSIQNLLGLTDKERGQILSINMANNPSRLYKEVWIGLGGTQSAVYATEVSVEEFDKQIEELGWGAKDIATMGGMYIERSMYNLKKNVRDFMREVLELLFAAAALLIDTLRTFFLIVLAILGPIAFAISVWDGFQSTLTQWMCRYIQIYLWLPVSDLFSSVLAKIQVLMLENDISELQNNPNFSIDSSNGVYIVFMIIGILGYFTIPTVAGWIIQAGGMGSAARPINQIAGRTGGMAGAAAGAVAGNLAGRAGTAAGNAAQSVGRGAVNGARKVAQSAGKLFKRR